MNQQELPDRSLVSLTEDELTTLLTLLEPSSDEADPNKALYNKLRNLKDIDCHPLFVSIYQSLQAYGGPEEGGWYYHLLELDSCSPVHDLEDAIFELLSLADNPKLDSAPLYRMYIALGYAVHSELDRYGEGPVYYIEQYPGQHQDLRQRRYE